MKSARPGRQRPIQRKTLAQEMADTLTEEIVSGGLKPGDALPTEPELAEEFQVSRSVVRDATRVLVARGLVSVQHGRGAFVTESQLDAFGEAVLLALRRERASVWDVEEFFEHFWPEVFALAAERATEEEVELVAAAADAYIAAFEQIAAAEMEQQQENGPEELAMLQERFAEFTAAILDASHNKLVSLLATPIQKLRSARSWEISSMSLEETVELEASGFRNLVSALRAHAPSRAREAVSEWFALPEVAVEATKNTPVGETVSIPLPLPGMTPVTENKLRSSTDTLRE